MCTHWHYLSIYWDTCVYITSDSLFGSFIWVQNRLCTTAGWLEATTLCACVSCICVYGGYGQVCLQHERINVCVNLHGCVCVCVCALAGMRVAMSAWGGVCVHVPSGAEVKTNHWMSALYWQMSWNKMGGNRGMKKRRRHEEGGEGLLPLCTA